MRRAVTQGWKRRRAARSWLRAAFGVVALVAGVSTPAAAQETSERPGVGAEALPLLPVDHWAARAAARAHALGLAPGYFPAQRAPTRGEAAAAFRQAMETAPAGSPLASLAEGWHRRLLEEFPELDGASPAASLKLLGGGAGASVEAREGWIAPAVRTGGQREAPYPVDDASRADAFVRGGFSAGRALSVAGEVRGGTEDVELPWWDVATGVGPISLRLAKQGVGYASGRGGGVTLAPPFPMARLELATTRPVRLPLLGPATFHTFGTRLEMERSGDPYFWGARFAFRPHPRVTVAVNRASMFGGDSISTPVNARNVARMLVGVLSRDFENQVVSADFAYRLPTERVLPATLYLEWGADDGSGAWWTVPGIVGGAFVPALPGLPQVGLGVEAAFYDVTCCGNGPWYYHGTIPGGWVWHDRLLSHPLGGEGKEVMLYGHAELADARLRLDGRVLGRWREAVLDPGVGNLYLPDRGRSVGVGLDAAWRVVPRSELRLRWAGEHGDAWTEHWLRAELSYLF